jgi:hypothetical protein
MTPAIKEWRRLKDLGAYRTSRPPRASELTQHQAACAMARLRGKLRFAKTEEDRAGVLAELDQAERALRWTGQ